MVWRFKDVANMKRENTVTVLALTLRFATCARKEDTIPGAAGRASKAAFFAKRENTPPWARLSACKYAAAARSKLRKQNAAIALQASIQIIRWNQSVSNATREQWRKMRALHTVYCAR